MTGSAPETIHVPAYPEWSREDLVASILAALSYFNILAGMALALLNQWSGYILTINALACAIGMYAVIDPKLRWISEDYEKKQKMYLEELDRIVGWDEKTTGEGKA